MWIYKITNDVNNKSYIGQTIRPIEDRFTRHINDAMNGKLDTHFARAIRKYGPEHFHIAVIDLAETQEELTIREQFWIREYDTVNQGYNETDAIDKCGGNTYQSKTEEELNVIKEKIRRTKMGGNNPNAKKVKMIDISTGLEIIFDSIIGCARYLGIRGGKTSIMKILNGMTSTPYKKRYMFEYCDA